MPATLTVHDETTAGDRSDPIVLEFLAEEITVRELIRQRVYQEVQDYNLRIEQSDLDWRGRYAKACREFECGRVLVFHGDCQAERLDDMVELTPSVGVTFLRLVPLAGG
ncbi:MAG: hypothetical protein AAF750_08220 [Planctomycetota bacterium]